MGGCREPQAENGCNVIVKLENWRRLQNLLDLRKIKVFDFISGKHLCRIIQLFCIMLRTAGRITQPYGII